MPFCEHGVIGDDGPRVCRRCAETAVDDMREQVAGVLLSEQRRACAEAVCRVCREHGPPQIAETDSGVELCTHPILANLDGPPDSRGKVRVFVHCRAEAIWLRGFPA